MVMDAHKKAPLRVLAADDSAVMREALRMMFAMHARGEARYPAMDLCGLAGDGVEALTLAEELKPDVMLLDLEMPRLDGLRVIEEMSLRGLNMPVILCCTHTERSARATLDALAMGARDYVMKPGREVDPLAAMTVWMRQLLPKIAALGSGERDVQMSDLQVAPAKAGPEPAAEGRPEVVVIAVSTGGPAALEIMLPMLPANLAAPVLIVQHMPRLFTGVLAERLRRICRLPVTQAKAGETIRPGAIWLAPGDQHMEIVPGPAGRGHAIRLHQGPALNSCMPSADYLFRSAARVYGASTLAVVMTGMGADGVEGARAVREAGGSVLAQDEASSAVWGMPGRTVQAEIANQVVPLRGLAATVFEKVNRRSRGPAQPVEGSSRMVDENREVEYGVH